MLARSLWLLAGILILTKCAQGVGRQPPFGVNQWSLTDERSYEQHFSTARRSDIQISDAIKPPKFIHWCYRVVGFLLRIFEDKAGRSGNARNKAAADYLQSKHQIPQYVLDHAPLVHLYSEEKFWPCDIAEHLLHVTAELNYTPVQFQSANLNLTNLDELNEWGKGRYIYLTSDDNVEDIPEWLSGQENIPHVPDAPEGRFAEGSKYFGSSAASETEKRLRESKTTYGPPSKGELKQRSHVGDSDYKIPQQVRTQHQRGGRSNAPAILICVNKGEGIVDAFWFFFYGFNLGNEVFNVRFGNHVGDWEHTLIRFQHGVPKYVFFSEHNFGAAYGYGAVEKIDKRVSSSDVIHDRANYGNNTSQKPIAYSAVGTHAMYATAGAHPYILPLGILHDQTDRGPLWDPLLNLYTYTYNHLTDELRPAAQTPDVPTEWFYFAGHWGDKVYPLADRRQYRFAMQYHYVSGPLGPRFKNLGRRKVCQGRDSDPCVIKNWLAPIEGARDWKGPGDGEEEEDSK